jgi:hypothetical protein
MGTGSVRALALALAVFLACSGIAVVTAQETERIEGTRRPRPSLPACVRFHQSSDL